MGTAARRQDYDYLIKLLLIGDSGELADSANTEVLRWPCCMTVKMPALYSQRLESCASSTWRVLQASARAVCC